MTEKYLIRNKISIPASELFLKYSLNFANFTLDIRIKYILIKEEYIAKKHNIKTKNSSSTVSVPMFLNCGIGLIV